MTIFFIEENWAWRQEQEQEQGAKSVRGRCTADTAQQQYI